MSLTINNLEMLLVVAAVASILAQRIRIPVSATLVLAGVLLTLLPYAPRIALTKSLIFAVFLPPLVFEGALSISWKELRQDLFPVLVLASAGVLISMGITAVGMHWFLRWDWLPSMAFGALIASTDPVAVIALFKSLDIRGRLRLLVESESLFNDVVAVVLFGLVLSLSKAHPGQSGFLTVSGHLLYLAAGSVMCGFLVSWATHLLAGRTQDLMIGNLLTFVAAFGSFTLADSFHLSGILACVVAGISIGNSKTFLGFSSNGRASLLALWETIAFIVNSVIFVLIGVRIAHENFLSDWMTASFAIIIVLLSRAGTVYPLSALFRSGRWRLKMSHQHILFWGGLRGPLALALSLGLPESFPDKDAIVSLTFAVVAFSIIVQGLTIGPIMKKTGLGEGGIGSVSAGRPESQPD
ncbi:MAG: cation:proton antiporter [Leptospirillum sp.]